MNRSIWLLGAAVFGVTLTAGAHDTWLQTNTNVVRVGDVIHVDLMLGNHGNDHRDFKLNSRIGLDSITALEIIGPDGKVTKLKDRVVDTGLNPKDGFWTARFVAAKPGLHVAVQTAEKTHAKAGKNVLVHRSAKTYFLASPSLDKIAATPPAAWKALGHRFEVVPESDIAGGAGAGKPIQIRLMHLGKPLAGCRVSFIPRGVTLAEDFDSKYERLTDKEGRASFTPDHGNYYLIVAHHLTPDERGPGHEGALYTATMTVYVPEKSYLGE